MQPASENTVNVPAFLGKLWKMVNDPNTDQLISWNKSGTGFIIQNQAQFWYELLPIHYKHNNMSSFVRQLNMYGFHKISAMDNGSSENDKDEIQFSHPQFQKDKPELLAHIKRKVTATTKSSTPVVENTNQSINGSDFLKVLSDVRLLKGKQKTVDSQLLAMKKENTVLWRELALQRQKHLKQQQIVNKLIQFLVTIVQPLRMGNMGVKRHGPLMLDESPEKKVKPTPSECPSSDGPEIQELDSAEILQGELLAETVAQEEGVETTSENAGEINSDVFFTSPELMDEEILENIFSNEVQEPNTSTAEPNVDNVDNNEKVFLSSTTRDTLLSNLSNGSSTSKLKNDNVEDTMANATDETTVVAKNFPPFLSRLNSIDDFDTHVESTQGELDQLKDILNGFSSLDANALLGLFDVNCSSYGLTTTQNEDAFINDPMMSGSEMATYAPQFDFSQLFDDSSEELLPIANPLPSANVDSEGSITTPQLLSDAPQFPPTSS